MSTDRCQPERPRLWAPVSFTEKSLHGVRQKYTSARKVSRDSGGRGLNRRSDRITCWVSRAPTRQVSHTGDTLYKSLEGIVQTVNRGDWAAATHCTM